MLTSMALLGRNAMTDLVETTRTVAATAAVTVTGPPDNRLNTII